MTVQTFANAKGGHGAMKHNPYASKVLDPTVHGRLVADLEDVAAKAGIQPRWIWTPLAECASKEEVTWVKRFRFHYDEDHTGLVLHGRDPSPDAETRMSAIAGALTRNFIAAKVMTVGQVLEALKLGNPLAMSCLLIPNFFVEKAMGGNLPQWAVAMLFDLLSDRHTRGLQTVIYASDLACLGSEYGKMMMRHIGTHFQQLDL